nr:forkhead protein sep1 [Quercus suber]
MSNAVHHRRLSSLPRIRLTAWELNHPASCCDSCSYVSVLATQSIFPSSKALYVHGCMSCIANKLVCRHRPPSSAIVAVLTSPDAVDQTIVFQLVLDITFSPVAIAPLPTNDRRVEKPFLLCLWTEKIARSAVHPFQPVSPALAAIPRLPVFVTTTAFDWDRLWLKELLLPQVCAEQMIVSHCWHMTVMQHLDLDNFTGPHAFEDEPHTHEFQYSSSREDHDCNITRTDFAVSYDGCPLGDSLPRHARLPDVKSEALIVIPCRHSDLISSVEDDIVGSGQLFEQQAVTQPQYSNWQSLEQQAVLASVPEQDLDYWTAQQQGQDANHSDLLHSGYLKAMPSATERADSIKYNPSQHASDHTAPTTRSQRISSVGAEVCQHNNSFVNSERLDTAIADIEGDDPCYAKLLFQALKETPGYSLDLKSIYEWIKTRSNKTKGGRNLGWRNSVRHNLSMNAAFMRIGHRPYSRETAKTSWKLTDKAIREGIQSTTRYRKTPKQTKPREGAPAVQRQQSGAKGGQATKKTTLARQARKKLEHRRKLWEQQQEWQHRTQQFRQYAGIDQASPPGHLDNGQAPETYPPPPRQQVVGSSPYFGTTTLAIQEHQTLPYMPILDIPGQPLLPPTSPLPYPHQSAHFLQASTLSEIVLPTTTESNFADNGDPGFVNPYINESLFGEDSGFSEMDMTPRDDNLEFMNARLP